MGVWSQVRFEPWVDLGSVVASSNDKFECK